MDFQNEGEMPLACDWQISAKSSSEMLNEYIFIVGLVIEHCGLAFNNFYFYTKVSSMKNRNQ